jgi:allophanate hydrolase
MKDLCLRIGALAELYALKTLQPADVIEHIYTRIAARGEDRVWIHLVPRQEALERARALTDPTLPLYGIPFAVKDNIDVADLPTSAGCPGFRYTAARSANVVERLLAAGAILIGKTNLDQFATGLTGTRSPYGIPVNPFDARYIPGGSSSGSAVAVSSGLVSFALGTDTAGSGRVPAAFNNIVGLKPTRGALSTRGVVPACRTLDCVSVFALTCDDAAAVAQVLAGFDPEDPFSRREAAEYTLQFRGPFQFGVPDRAAMEYFGNEESPLLLQKAIENLEELGGTPVATDFAPLREAACLLYQGPWVAERLAAIRDFFESDAADLHPVTRSIICGARQYSAVDAFQAAYRLAELKRCMESVWSLADVLLLPTAGTCFTIDEVMADPIQRNNDLGYYTNFANLLELCGVAVPAGFYRSGLPFGVSLIGPAGSDGLLLGIADRLHRFESIPMGTGAVPVPSTLPSKGRAILAVVGAHLRGLPLNPQLLEHGAQFLRERRTAPMYRLYELPGSSPRKPGLVRVADGGASIEMELWEMPVESFGSFIDKIPPPLGLGTIILETGDQVKGFLCEAVAGQTAIDISSHGGWRQYLAVAEANRS